VHPYAQKNGEPLAPDYPASEANYTGPFGQKNSASLGIDYIKLTPDAHGDSHKAAWMSPPPGSTRAGWLRQAYDILAARRYVIGMSWYSYFSSTGSGFNIYDRATDQPTLTFQAFDEITAPPPANHDFAKPQVVGDYPASAIGKNLEATLKSGDPHISRQPER